MPELMLYDKMRGAIEKCHSMDELKGIRDKAEALRYAARIAGDDEVFRKCAEIKLRAERRAGELLRDMDKRKPGDTDKKIMLQDETLSPTLADLGIERIDSHRWQKIAEIPAKDFDAFLSREEIPSTAGALRFQRAAERGFPEEPTLFENVEVCIKRLSEVAALLPRIEDEWQQVEKGQRDRLGRQAVRVNAITEMLSVGQDWQRFLLEKEAG